MKERRRGQRIATNLAVKWRTSVGPFDSTVIDLSNKGCFILTATQTPPNKVSRVKQVPGNETVDVELRLSPDHSLKLQGQVVYKVESTGFAVRFLALTSDDERVLRTFIEKQHGESSESLAFPRVG